MNNLLFVNWNGIPFDYTDYQSKLEINIFYTHIVVPRNSASWNQIHGNFIKIHGLLQFLQKCTWHISKNWNSGGLICPKYNQPNCIFFSAWHYIDMFVFIYISFTISYFRWCVLYSPSTCLRLIYLCMKPSGHEFNDIWWNRNCHFGKLVH